MKYGNEISPKFRDISSRSQTYQYQIREIVWDFAESYQFSNEDGISGKLDNIPFKEEIMVLQEELFERIWKIALKICTERQLQVLRLFLDGYTQLEMAAELGVHQSTVNKTLLGSQGGDGRKYHYNPHKKYGGAIPKIKKNLHLDPEIAKILQRIEELS